MAIMKETHKAVLKMRLDSSITCTKFFLQQLFDLTAQSSQNVLVALLIAIMVPSESKHGGICLHHCQHSVDPQH